MEIHCINNKSTMNNKIYLVIRKITDSKIAKIKNLSTVINTDKF